MMSIMLIQQGEQFSAEKAVIAELRSPTPKSMGMPSPSEWNWTVNGLLMVTGYTTESINLKEELRLGKQIAMA